MKIDLEHIHYWMCAIRDSADPIRTLDAFWRGQMISKQWLIESLKTVIEKNSRLQSQITIDIHGGWVGTLASMLFQSGLSIKFLQSIDVDPVVQPIASNMNKKEEIEGRFKSVHADMCDFKSSADIIINTSCEHISQDQYDQWLLNIPEYSLILLQSNNYEIDEHIRIAKDLEEFRNQSHIEEIWSGELELPLYKRFMIIGKKYS